jgi:hypothetical protein
MAGKDEVKRRKVATGSGPAVLTNPTVRENTEATRVGADRGPKIVQSTSMMGDTKELAVPDRILDGVAEVAFKMLAKGLEIAKWGATGRTGNALSAFTPGSIEHAPRGPGRLDGDASEPPATGVGRGGSAMLSWLRGA